MSGAESFYLVVVIATFIVFAATLMVTTAEYERHKAGKS